jgi:hypothetical protein
MFCGADVLNGLQRAPDAPLKTDRHFAPQIGNKAWCHGESNSLGSDVSFAATRQTIEAKNWNVNFPMQKTSKPRTLLWRGTHKPRRIL